MKIKVKISRGSYIGLMLLLTYRKPSTILITLAGLVSLGFTLVHYIGTHPEGDKPPVFQIAFAVAALVVLPFFIVRFAGRAYDTSALLQETIEYEFTNDYMAMTGQSFNVEKDWDMLPRVEEIGKWFFVYESEKMANLIPFSAMTSQELASLRSFFHTLQGVNSTGVK